MANPIHTIQSYYRETLEEAKKCTWPTWRELVDHTGIVLSIVAVLTTFVVIIDNLCRVAVQFIIGL
jgi:preprotein translocase SecE subunit